MALEAIVGKPGTHRIILQQAREGVYVFIFERPDSPFPEWDYLQDTWEQAKGFCLRKRDIPLDAWREIADQRIGSIGPGS